MALDNVQNLWVEDFLSNKEKLAGGDDAVLRRRVAELESQVASQERWRPCNFRERMIVIALISLTSVLLMSLSLLTKDPDQLRLIPAQVKVFVTQKLKQIIRLVIQYYSGTSESEVEINQIVVSQLNKISEFVKDQGDSIVDIIVTTQWKNISALYSNFQSAASLLGSNVYANILQQFGFAATQAWSFAAGYFAVNTLCFILRLVFAGFSFSLRQLQSIYMYISGRSSDRSTIGILPAEAQAEAEQLRGIREKSD